VHARCALLIGTDYLIGPDYPEQLGEDECSSESSQIDLAGLQVVFAPFVAVSLDSVAGGPVMHQPLLLSSTGGGAGKFGRHRGAGAN